MSDFIKREDAIETAYQLRRKPNDEEWEEWLKAFNAVPSADRPQGEWVLDPNGMDWNIPAWRCSRCGFVANYIGTEANGLGRNPMNWAGSKYCPNCGCRMKGADDEM